jgi:hypothetical protein
LKHLTDTGKSVRLKFSQKIINLDKKKLETSEAQNDTEFKEYNFIRETVNFLFKSLNCFFLPCLIGGGINGMSSEET